MADFKQGQRVRYISDTMPNLKGKEGTVQGVTDRGWVEVVFDGYDFPTRCAQVNLQIVDRRKEMLDAVFDLMTAYLVDECPDDANWEDFDPEIDGLRSQVSDLGGGS